MTSGMTTTDGAARPVLVRGARLLGGEIASVLMREGRIAATHADADRDAAGCGAEVVDADGLIALPGLVDLHTHLREPGREDSETVAGGSRAAAAGGFVAVHAMANTSPVADSAGVVEQVWRLGREAGWADVRPVGAVTLGLGGERLAEIGAMAGSAARVRVFSDDGHCVHDPLVMRRALEYVRSVGGVVAQHAQDPRLTEGAQMNEGVVSAELGLPGWPCVAEEAVIARDVLLAAHVGGRVHVCHVSTAGSVEIVRLAKERGMPVTAEVTPHHLMLTDDEVRTYDPVFKVNPPLRTEADVRALRLAVADGTIDVIATDHAPHPREDKECEWAAAAMGMSGLETALAVVQAALVDTGLMDWAAVAQRMSGAPARIGRLDDPGLGTHAHTGRLAVGEPAHLTLHDPAGAWSPDPAALVSAGRNTPFAGRTLPGRPVATYLRGVPTALDGRPVDAPGPRDRSLELVGGHA